MKAAQRTMRAAVIRNFGGPEELRIERVPVPEPGGGEVMIKIEYAGIGRWDPFEREGGYARMLGIEPSFPYILGSEGSGIVAAVGPNVRRFKPGDPVFAAGFLNPRGGFYAEYASAAEDLVVPMPAGFSMMEAGATAGVGLTALRGLADVLGLSAGESICIFGAGGGIGHVAVRIALALGARVIAVTSGKDGVEFARSLGAGTALDGRDPACAEELRKLGPNAFDKALITAGSEIVETVLDGLKKNGKVAFPAGVHPEPNPRQGADIMSFNGEPDRDILERLLTFLSRFGVKPHIGRTFRLEEAAEAHRTLQGHFLGKLVFEVSGGL